MRGTKQIRSGRVQKVIDKLKDKVDLFETYQNEADDLLHVVYEARIKGYQEAIELLEEALK